MIAFRIPERAAIRDGGPAIKTEQRAGAFRCLIVIGAVPCNRDVRSGEMYRRAVAMARVWTRQIDLGSTPVVAYFLTAPHGSLA
jgi:hypothetical protein